MKEISSKIYHDDEFDIDINQYLTYAQIQQIANAVITTSKEDDSWATRQTNVDMLVLYHATNIGKEKLEEIGHDALLASGLIDRVDNRVLNICQIYEAIGFTESWKRAGFKFISQLPELMNNETLNAVLKKYAKPSEK